MPTFTPREIVSELDRYIVGQRAAERAVGGGPEVGTRDKLRHMLREGKLDERTVELEVTRPVSPMIEVMTPQGMEEIETNLKDMLQNLLPKRSKKTRMQVPEALETLAQEEAARLIDMEAATKEAIRRVEQSGIVFIDEIDKIAGREGMHGPDVSREGVQRDLLPIVEGSTVNTKHGPVRTDHIGARRLHTVMERLLDEISFDAPEMGGREVVIDAAYVRERLNPILQDQDLSRYIL